MNLSEKTSKKYLLVDISGAKYVANVADIVEVSSKGEYVKVSADSASIIGYACIRSEVIPLINANFLYEKQGEAGNLWLIVKHLDKKYVITVSAVIDIIDVIGPLEQLGDLAEFVRLADGSIAFSLNLPKLASAIHGVVITE